MPGTDRLKVDVSKAVYACDDSTGGDRVDVLAGPDGRIHLVIVDACGHGARAESLADMILDSVRTFLWQGLTPAMVFRSLNLLLLERYRDRGDTSFGTGAIISFDSERPIATFASAGHVDALRFSSDGKQHSHHSSTGLLYGVAPEAQYHDTTFAYSPGDAFVLVSDGLLEARPVDKSSEFLGTAGLCRIIGSVLASGAVSAERLISTVREITGAFGDDVAAMIAVTKPTHVPDSHEEKPVVVPSFRAMRVAIR